MAQRHPRETPAAIPMAQWHPGDTPSSNPHGTAPHAPHARHAQRPSSQPATAFHGTAPHARHARRSLPLRSQKSPQLTSANPRIPRACHDFATPHARPHTRFVAQGHEIQRFWRKRTIHCACHADPPSSAFPGASMHPKSHTCHAKRRSQRVKSCVRATHPEPNPHGTAPPTRPASTLPARSQHARSPQPATRNAR